MNLVSSHSYLLHRIVEYSRFGVVHCVHIVVGRDVANAGVRYYCVFAGLNFIISDTLVRHDSRRSAVSGTEGGINIPVRMVRKRFEN